MSSFSPNERVLRPGVLSTTSLSTWSEDALSWSELKHPEIMPTQTSTHGRKKSNLYIDRLPLAACPDTCFDLDIIGEVLY